MREEFFAIHLEHGACMQLVSDTFYEHEKCSMRKIAYLNENPRMIVLPKNSSYYDMFKIGYVFKICPLVIYNDSVSP